MNRLTLLILGTLLASGTMVSSGCRSCLGACANSEATLTVHLPPEADVTAPETLTICRGSKCLTTGVPAASTDQNLAMFAIPQSTVSGSLWAEKSGVRVLQITWFLDTSDVNAANPRDDYMLTVTDATGTQTGALSDAVLYAHSRGCCDDRDIWTGQLSD